MRKISRAQEQHGELNFRNAHDESKYSRPDEYAYARRSGASHEEVIDAHERGLDIGGYAIARHSGNSHEQLMDAHERGVKFAHARGNINFDDSDWRSQYSDLDSDW